jgi:hypothetical protein
LRPVHPESESRRIDRRRRRQPLATCRAKVNEVRIVQLHQIRTVAVSFLESLAAGPASLWKFPHLPHPNARVYTEYSVRMTRLR